MTDFELRRSLRELNAPRQPRNDLWAGIAARIADEAAEAEAVQPAVRRRRAWMPLAAAASFLFVAAAGTLMFAMHRPMPAPEGVAEIRSSASPNVPRVSPSEARDFIGAPAGDPRLVGAAVVLDAAHAELQQALEQRPDAVFLVSLLNRTNARRMKLDHFGANAG